MSQAEWFIADGDREIGPLTEVELRKRLKKGDRDKLRVRQGEAGNWYSAKFVVRKFRKLAETGVYIKMGSVAGPYTAERAYAILSELTLEKIQAKVGLHGHWVSAAKLLAKLDRLINKTDKPSADDNATSKASVSSDTEIINRSGLVSLASDPEVDNDIPLISPIDEDIPIVDPIDDDIPLVNPIDDDIPLVDPIDDDIPVVQPSQNSKLPPAPAPNQVVHRCSCGHDIQILREHLGMQLQCPLCGITFNS